MDKVDRLREAGKFPARWETFKEFQENQSKSKRIDKIVTVLLGVVVMSLTVATAAQMVIERGM